MGQGAGESVVRGGFFGDAAVVEDGVKIECGAVHFDRRGDAALDHVGEAEGVRINGAEGEWPFGVAGALGGELEEIAVEGDVLPGERPLFYRGAPFEEMMGHVGFA